MLIGGADKHEACHWATQRAMAGLRTAARERREFDRVLRVVGWGWGGGVVGVWWGVWWGGCGGGGGGGWGCVDIAG